MSPIKPLKVFNEILHLYEEREVDFEKKVKEYFYKNFLTIDEKTIAFSAAEEKQFDDILNKAVQKLKQEDVSKKSSARNRAVRAIARFVMDLSTLGFWRLFKTRSAKAQLEGLVKYSSALVQSRKDLGQDVSAHKTIGKTFNELTERQKRVLKADSIDYLVDEIAIQTNKQDSIGTYLFNLTRNLANNMIVLERQVNLAKSHLQKRTSKESVEFNPTKDTELQSINKTLEKVAADLTNTLNQLEQKMTTMIKLQKQNDSNLIKLAKEKNIIETLIKEEQKFGKISVIKGFKNIKNDITKTSGNIKSEQNKWQSQQEDLQNDIEQQKRKLTKLQKFVDENYTFDVGKKKQARKFSSRIAE